ncbi:NADH-quinone oxidoreductase subunit H, partial [Salmonella enterica subsp. enterica serovar Anatum]|nr:NADH-quinone oxidoreductase subunit H [Salmonella enterica subsp. enterica serovar Anatum]
AAFNTLFVHRIVFIGFVLFFNFRFFTTRFTRTRRTAIVGIQITPLPQLGDLITLIYLFAIARFFFSIAGLDTGSPFTAIGASREA